MANIGEPDSGAIDEFVRQYQAELPKLQAYCGQMEALLNALLAASDIQHSHTESRCKSVEAYRDKIARKGYTDPARQMTDRVGLRMVMFYDSDVDAVSGLIQREFNVDEANSEDQRAPVTFDSFGYRSFHLVFTLDARRAALPEWAAFAGVPVELQIRTVLAHAWAAVGHQLAYKHVARLSPKGQRLLSRISALLETTDELFETLRIEYDQNHGGNEDLPGVFPRLVRDTNDGADS